jgi:hypothetical protein
MIYSSFPISFSFCRSLGCSPLNVIKFFWENIIFQIFHCLYFAYYTFQERWYNCKNKHLFWYKLNVYVLGFVEICLEVDKIILTGMNFHQFLKRWWPASVATSKQGNYWTCRFLTARSLFTTHNFFSLSKESLSSVLVFDKQFTAVAQI